MGGVHPGGAPPVRQCNALQPQPPPVPARHRARNGYHLTRAPSVRPWDGFSRTSDRALAYPWPPTIEPSAVDFTPPHQEEPDPPSPGRIGAFGPGATTSDLHSIRNRVRSPLREEGAVPDSYLTLISVLGLASVLRRARTISTQRRRDRSQHPTRPAQAGVADRPSCGP